MANIFTSIKAKLAPQSIIKAIHNDFDTATEKILEEAKAILSLNPELDYTQALRNAGFISSKRVRETGVIFDSQKTSKENSALIAYYRENYPFQKFITESAVEAICKKYGLVCGYVTYYKGDVPEKNIREISAFSLKEAEWFKSEPYGWRIECDVIISNEKNMLSKYKTIYKEKMKICATIKDFDTTLLKIKDGYKLGAIKDPVVLQPVRGGYLIVSKWGIEAEDKLIN